MKNILILICKFKDDISEAHYYVFKKWHFKMEKSKLKKWKLDFISKIQQETENVLFIKILMIIVIHNCIIWHDYSECIIFMF